MEKLNNRKFYISIVLFLVLVLSATIGFTMAVFGDSKQGSTEIELGASILFSDNGVGVSPSTAVKVVPGETLDVETTLTIKKGEGKATQGVLRVSPKLNAGNTTASLSLISGATYAVKINGTEVSDAVMVVNNRKFYLVAKDDNNALYPITPTDAGITISFKAQVVFPLSILSALSGEACNVSMKGVVVQTPIHKDDENNTPIALTIADYRPYFEMYDPTLYEFSDDGKYIYFGSYPQTIKASSVTVGTTTDENGYYTGSDGEKYAKVTANMYGTSDQYKASDGTTMSTGTGYYFKVEPLKWRVLSNDGSTALIVCDQAITAMAYDAVSDNNYKNSDLRAFLIGDFYDKAFNTSEQAIIQTTNVDNSAASTGYASNSYACANTDDKIFALSYSEATNTAYGFTNSTSTDSNRTWSGSDYAKANYLYVYSSNSWVWLRSPDYGNSYRAWYVSSDSSLNRYLVYNSDGGVVPALQLSL